MTTLQPFTIRSFRNCLTLIIKKSNNKREKEECIWQKKKNTEIEK